MQPRNEKFFPVAGKARTPSSLAAILPEVVAPRERWAKLAKWTTAELHGRRSPNRPAPKRTAPRHPARVAQIVARLSRRTDQILVPCAAYTGQRRRPATPLDRHPARS
jgi:hypothetical protein